MRIPEPPKADDVLTVEQYGLLMFRFVLECGTTATMSDEQCEKALYAGNRVVACPRDTYGDLAYARLVECHRLISDTVRRRAQSDQRIVIASGVTPDQPNAGPMARLEPQPITRPPSGGHSRPIYDEYDEPARVDRVQF